MSTIKDNSLINEEIEFENRIISDTHCSPSGLIDSDSFIDERTLTSALLFACEKCDGPLIPISGCLVCKKTVFRKCIKCDLIKKVGNHDNCFLLLSYFLYFKKSPTNKWDGV